MNMIPFSQARSHLTDIANQVQHKHETWVLTKNNKPAIAIIPIEALNLLMEMIEEREDEEDLKAVLASRGQPTRPLHDVLKELGLRDVD
jgi:prevent-host-death family protein